MSGLALLTPFAPPSVRGNAITVERVARGLRERGANLNVWDLSRTAEADVERGVEAYRPALVHAFHARRAGPAGLRLARRLEVPLIVTLTGTDANHDLLDAAHAALVRRVLEGAAAITAFHASIVEGVAAVLPDVRTRLVVVPQSVAFASDVPVDLAARWRLPPDRVLFLFPAGIRPVKGPRTPLGPLDALAAADPRVRLAYAGPILDGAEGAAWQRALAARPWARHLGEVPHAEMASLLRQADVVLNCSVSEGGLANSVLEALTLERAVLASDIPGNRGLVVDGVTGLLFRGGRELAAQAARLVRDAALRERLGRAGRALVAREYPPEREVDGYLEVYRGLVPILSALR
ncbi:MAG TPA: glycosyltransferase [Methylomirabilota bacterium]|nr:glycosyltransferase [Methylomirabilota bacterium]